MEYKPFTKKQKEVIRVTAGIVNLWLNSNDISSPTMRSDIWEELWKLDGVSELDLYEIEAILNRLLTVIQYVDGTRTAKPN